MGDSKSASGGIGFTGLMTILFVGLKLTGYIGWSWWWVLAPVWIPVLLAVILFAVVGFLEARSTWSW